jgi:hypothetical protein
MTGQKLVSKEKDMSKLVTVRLTAGNQMEHVDVPESVARLMIRGDVTASIEPSYETLAKVFSQEVIEGIRDIREGRYTTVSTDEEQEAFFRWICKEAGVPYEE